MADTRIYKSDPLNALNVEFQAFQGALMEVSFSKPAAYFKLRKKAMQYLLTEGLKKMHDTIFNFLYKGTRPPPEGGGRTAQAIDLGEFDAEVAEAFDGGVFSPNISEKECDIVAMGVVKAYQKIVMEQVLDKVLPPSIFSEALQRSSKKSMVDME